MTDETKAGDKAEHQAPKGSETEGHWPGSGKTGAVDYRAHAGWTVLRRKDKDTPAAEMFSVSYLAPDAGVGRGTAAGAGAGRPVTFLFNGGPGASSAYLHVGAVGPRRVAFPPDGTLPTMPPRLVDNEASWLAFTDLVFVDPVGTGFSRIVDASDDKNDKGNGDKASDPKEFFGQKRDLESLCEFAGRWLSRHDRWASPVFIAGESYGGYRVGRLVRLLQETTGIGLNGAILISPALELGGLFGDDYDIGGWMDRVPTMAAAAFHHGRYRGGGPARGRAAKRKAPGLDGILAEATDFARNDYARFLAQGAAMPEAQRAAVLARLGDLTGLAPDIVARCEGRVPIDLYVRELLRDERKVVGFYDTTITATDPFPDRPSGWPDPTLSGITPAYTMAVNRLLRGELGIDTDREYTLLSLEVNQAWKNDADHHAFDAPIPGATDDFRYGMALNPHLRAFITHGRHDLVTPFATSDRLRDLMRLDPATAGRITVRHFHGGHMFYAWESSRREFTAAIAAFVAACLPGPAAG